MIRFATSHHSLRFVRRLILLFVTLLLISAGFLHEAHAQRTVVVEPGFGTLNDAIHGDTTAAGVHNASTQETVYVLKGGLEFEDRYYLNGAILAGNYHLRIELEDGSPVPAVLQVLTDETGASAGVFIESEGDVTLRGLYMLGMDDLDAPRSQHVIINGDNKTLDADRVFIDYNRFIVFRFNGENGSLRLTNSWIRNVMTTNNPGNGKVVDARGNHLNEVYVENTTFWGVSAEFIRYSGGIHDYMFFHHNTIYNMHAFVRDDFRENSNKMVRGVIANNLFINMGWVGDTLTVANPPSNHRVGIFSFDSLAVVPGLSESDRDVLISHNNFYWEPELADFFNSGFTATCDLCTGGTVRQYPLFNPRAQGFVDAGFVRFDNAIEENPGFVSTPGVTGYIDWAKAYWTDPATASPFYYDPDGSEVVGWPVPEDFSYSMTSASYTAATGGFPLGDLNWFPARKADWESQGGGTGVVVSREAASREIPREFALHGNYPNPFNPTTNIRLDLSVHADVSVEVFDLVGRRVLVLPAESMTPGQERSITVDASGLPSGVYVYRVRAEAPTETFVGTGRMVLLK